MVAIVQAIMFGVSRATRLLDAGSAGAVALRAVFAILVVGLDSQVR